MSFKKILGRASFLLVKFILLLTRIIPLKWSYALCDFVVFAGSRLNWKRKKIALDNIKIVFPELTLKDRQVIFRQSLRNMLKNYFEMAYIINGSYQAGDISKMVSVSGIEHLDNLKTCGKGALLYSGHFGNFPLMGVWLAINGYPVAAIYKEAANFPDDFFENIMRRLNVTPLKFKSDATLTASVIRALREKKIVLILNDQSHPKGIYIKFFNKWVPSPGGPALLAKRAGVPIIPAYICRNKDNHHFVKILPEIPLLTDDDLERFMQRNTQNLIDWIAEILLKHPTEWLWLHNRWKRAKPISDSYPE